MVAFSIILTINYIMPIILLSFPNTSSLILVCYVVFFTCIFNFLMYIYGQLSAIKDLLLLFVPIKHSLVIHGGIDDGGI